MTKYIALLRGIGPGNPNMSGANLREVCEHLGLQNVQPVLASGNLVFESDETDTSKLEAMLEAAWPEQLGFNSMTIVRTQAELSKILEHNPFAGMTHGPSSYLMATFLKHPSKPSFTLPHHPAGKPYKIIDYYESVLFSVTDNTVVKTTDLMTWLEKQFGKDITSRTWNTLSKINNKCSNISI